MNVISKEQAIKQGLKYYFTGIYCKYNHYCERQVSSGRCKKCKNLGDAKSYKKHRDARLNKAKIYYHAHLTEENIELRNERSRTWYKKNKVRKLTMAKKWRDSNPDKLAIDDAEYRSCKLTVNNDSKETEKIKQVYLKRDELNKLWGMNFQVDHIIPLRHKRVCGLHCWANLQLLDRSINAEKHNNFVEDW